MGTHTVLYIDEIKRGNYKPFIDHVLSQIPQVFTWRPEDEKVLSRYRQALLGITEQMSDSYCAVQDTADNILNICEEVMKDWWVNFVGKPINDDYWKEHIIAALRFFGMNMDIAHLVVLPQQLSAMAVKMLFAILRSEGDDLGALAMGLGKLASLVTAFYAEVVIHLMAESIGTPLSAFMNLANIIAGQLLNAQSQ